MSHPARLSAAAHASANPSHRLCRTASATIAEFVLPPGFVVPDHEHVPPHIMVMLDGAITDVDGQTLARCEPGSLRYAPGGDQHRVRVSRNGAHCLVIEAQGFPELRMQDRVYLDAARGADVVRSVRRWLFEERSASPARIEDSVLALFCRVRQESRGSEPAPWLAEVRAALDRTEASAAPLAQAAHAVQRSPSLVARAFRAEHAVSVHRYYRRRQIDRAWALLSDSAEPLSTIALACGFADQSHMTRVFVRETDISPARLRTRIAEGMDRNWYRASPLMVMGET